MRKSSLFKYQTLFVKCRHIIAAFGLTIKKLSEWILDIGGCLPHA